MNTQSKTLSVRIGLATAVLFGSVACGDEDGGGSPQPGNASGPLYGIGTSTFGEEGSASYLRFVDSLDLGGAEVELGEAREFPGNSDLTVFEGTVLVASGDAPTITRYEVAENGLGDVVGEVSFANFGLSIAPFYYSKMVAPDKAYQAAGATRIVVWDPTSMEITGTIDLPAIEERPGLQVVTGLWDRSGIVANGRFYLPIYWTDDQFADRSPDSLILEIDVATDTVVGTIEAPCPGLDYGTLDDDGLLHFSNWTGGAGTYWVLDTAQTCIATLDPTTGGVTTQTFASLADGHEGAAFQYVGGGRFVMAVFDEVRADVANATDPFTPLAGNNWRLWSYQPDGSTPAAPIEGIAWNSGAATHAFVGDDVFSMVPGEGYASTIVYRLDDDGPATLAYGINGWSYRLFKVR